VTDLDVEVEEKE